MTSQLSEVLEPAREDHVLLANGTAALLRRLVPRDRDAVAELFESCSEANLYTRFFTVGHAMVARHVDHLCGPASRAVSYVALVGERVIAVTEVEPCEPGTSEIAYLIAGDMRGLGAATLMLERARPRRLGVRHLVVPRRRPAAEPSDARSPHRPFRDATAARQRSALARTSGTAHKGDCT